MYRFIKDHKQKIIRFMQLTILIKGSRSYSSLPHIRFRDLSLFVYISQYNGFLFALNGELMFVCIRSNCYYINEHILTLNGKTNLGILIVLMFIFYSSC